MPVPWSKTVWVEPAVSVRVRMVWRRPVVVGVNEMLIVQVAAVDIDVVAAIEPQTVVDWKSPLLRAPVVKVGAAVKSMAIDERLVTVRAVETVFPTVTAPMLVARGVMAN